MGLTVKKSRAINQAGALFGFEPLVSRSDLSDHSILVTPLRVARPETVDGTRIERDLLARRGQTTCA
jgi:hypothetical protein